MIPVNFDSTIEALLSKSNLPTEDLREGSHAQLFAEFDGETLSGVVGIEIYGDWGLLRSLWVADPFRGKGLAGGLVRSMEVHASRNGVKY